MVGDSSGSLLRAFQRVLTIVSFGVGDGMEGRSDGHVWGETLVDDGEVASVSLVSLEKTECAGLFGPELMLRGESFKGDNDLFRS